MNIDPEISLCKAPNGGWLVTEQSTIVGAYSSADEMLDGLRARLCVTAAPVPVSTSAPALRIVSTSEPGWSIDRTHPLYQWKQTCGLSWAQMADLGVSAKTFIRMCRTRRPQSSTLAKIGKITKGAVTVRELRAWYAKKAA